MRKFAISDIHGCSRTLEALLDKLAVTTADEVYFLGDYIDRGPDSKGVIDLILDMKSEGYAVHCLMGNHEAYMLLSKDDPRYQPEWLSWGGRETLRSFGLHSGNQLNRIEKRYWAFLSELDPFFSVDDYLLVHAGFNFQAEDPALDFEAMLWIRDWYEDIDYDWLGPRMIVHGHTPVSTSIIRSLHRNLADGQVLDIDCGCVYPQREGVGYLCAFDLTNNELVFQPNCESGRKSVKHLERVIGRK